MYLPSIVALLGRPWPQIQKVSWHNHLTTIEASPSGAYCFKEYLGFMFEEQTCFTIGSRLEVDKKLLYDKLMAEEFSLVTYIDMEREDKVRAAYILDGARSMENVSDEDKQQNKGRLANNSISESCHASATEGLKTFGRIRLDYSGAMGQSRVNNESTTDRKSVVLSL